MTTLPLRLGRVVRIGTRSSELALRQAEQVRDALDERGVASELVTYTTIGDRRLDVALTAIGSKGLFTQELEDDLLAERVDCCVHSLKDLPTRSPAGVRVVARLRREDPRDALVLGPALGTSDDGGPALDRLPRGASVGTSSLRRRAQLLAARPDLEVRELRGNVPTRLRKVDAAEVDAAILAAAGLHRLGAAKRVSAYLGAPSWLPAAGQGAIAVEVREDDTEMVRLLGSLDHEPTALATRAERAFLHALEGGCQVPIGALASEINGAWTLYGLIADVAGELVVRGSRAFEPIGAERAGIKLASELHERGGAEILEALRDVRSPSPQPE